MFGVVRYLNYDKKNVPFTVLHVFSSLSRAKLYAYMSAENKYGKEVVDGVCEKVVFIDDEIIEGYTTDNGYNKFVYSVIELKNKKKGK